MCIWWLKISWLCLRHYYSCTTTRHRCLLYVSSDKVRTEICVIAHFEINDIQYYMDRGILSGAKTLVALVYATKFGTLVGEFSLCQT